MYGLPAFFLSGMCFRARVADALRGLSSAGNRRKKKERKANFFSVLGGARFVRASFFMVYFLFSGACFGRYSCVVS